MKTTFKISRNIPKYATCRNGFKYMICHKFFDTEIRRYRLAVYDFINDLIDLPILSDREVQIIQQPKAYHPKGK